MNLRNGRLALLALIASAACQAATIDFTTGFDSTALASRTFGSIVVTAASNTGSSGTVDVLFANYPGTVFWGNMGDMQGTTGGCTAGMGATCIGLGVQDSTGGGSKGISGGGGDEDEALIFNFGGISAVNQISFTLGGFDLANDTFRLLVEYSPSNGSPSDFIVANANSFVNTTTGLFNLGDVTGLNLNGAVSRVALMATTGHFGVTSLNYSTINLNEVPEPSTAGLALIGCAFAGLGLIRRNRKK